MQIKKKINSSSIVSPSFPPSLSFIYKAAFFFFLNFLGLFIYFYLWLCCVFVSVRGLSLVAASGGHSSSQCTGLSLSRPLLLRSTGSRRAGSVIVAHRPSCSAACGIFPDQGLNPCPLHWQADSQPLRHQGSPNANFKGFCFYEILVNLNLTPVPVSEEFGFEDPKECCFKISSERGWTSLAVQCLRLHASTAGGAGLIPGRGTKIPHAAQSGQKNKKIK